VVATVGIAQASTLGLDSVNAHYSAISIFRILDRKSKIDPAGDEGLVLDNVRGDIEFCHVSFRYPTRRDIPVFTNLSLSMPSGQVHILYLCPKFFSWDPQKIHFLNSKPVDDEFCI
jgi:ATP-binding cassette, subfamily B (MDR/TAP), member 1